MKPNSISNWSIILLLLFGITSTSCKQQKEDDWSILGSMYSKIEEIQSSDYAKDMYNMVNEYGVQLGDTVKKYAGDAKETFDNTDFQEIYDNLYQKSMENGEKLRNGVMDYAQKVSENYEGSKLKEYVDDLPENSRKLMKEAQIQGEKLRETLGEYAKDLATKYEKLEIQKTANELYESAQKHGETLKEKISENYEGSKVQEFVNKVPEYTERVLDAAEDYEMKVKETVTGYAQEIHKKYRGSKLQEMADEVYEQAKIHGEGLKETFSDYAFELSKSYEGSEIQKMAQDAYEKLKISGDQMKGILDEYTVGIQEMADKMEKYRSKKAKEGETVHNPFQCVLDKMSTNKDMTLKTMLAGSIIGAFRNSVRYSIRTGGRRSNVVSVYDKTVKSSLGNPKWFARVDMPHGKVSYPHINVNKAITGVKDPHIPISATTAKVAGGAGTVLNFINRIAPYMMIESTAYEINEAMCSLDEDIGKKVIGGMATGAGGYLGSSFGSSIGTAMFPGIGTLIGSIVGGAYGGEFGECFSGTFENAYEYSIDFWNMMNAEDQ